MCLKLFFSFICIYLYTYIHPAIYTRISLLQSLGHLLFPPHFLFLLMHKVCLHNMAGIFITNVNVFSWINSDVACVVQQVRCIYWHLKFSCFSLFFTFLKFHFWFTRNGIPRNKITVMDREEVYLHIQNKH